MFVKGTTASSFPLDSLPRAGWDAGLEPQMTLLQIERSLYVLMCLITHRLIDYFSLVLKWDGKTPLAIFSPLLASSAFLQVISFFLQLTHRWKLRVTVTTQNATVTFVFTWWIAQEIEKNPMPAMCAVQPNWRQRNSLKHHGLVRFAIKINIFKCLRDTLTMLKTCAKQEWARIIQGSGKLKELMVYSYFPAKTLVYLCALGLPLKLAV